MEPFYGKTLPSEFLQAMVDGLRAANADPQQQISMSSYGTVGFGGVCFGCAATWTLQELEQRLLTVDEIKALGFLTTVSTKRTFQVSEEQADRIVRFEFSMDSARSGRLGNLAYFCDIPFGELSPWEDQWSLKTENWKEVIPTVERAIAEMQSAGL
jgi:hypothetical protein